MSCDLPTTSKIQGEAKGSTMAWTHDEEGRKETTPLLSESSSRKDFSLHNNMAYYHAPASKVPRFDEDGVKAPPYTATNASDLSTSSNRAYRQYQPSIRQMSIAHWIIAFGLLLFVALVFSVLFHLPSFTLFSYHPTFMTAFIVCMTEGVALLQPTPLTAEAKQRGFRWHLWVQVASSGCLLIGFLCIFYNKQIHNKAHFESFHGKLGLTVFIYVWLQALFGIAMAVIPKSVFGSVDKGKQVWKYHRLTGYVLLLTVWMTAQLGVRADFMLANLINPNLMYFHWLVLTLVFGGLFYRLRIHKLGIK